MTRTLKIIAALALVCMSAPAFARGGGHGGMGGNDGQNGHAMNVPSWNLTENKSTTNTTNTTTWNKITNAPNGNKNVTHLDSGRHQEQIMRLRAELRQLLLRSLREQEAHNTAANNRTVMQIKHVERELKKDGVQPFSIF